ncbi:MAG: peptidase M61 [Dyella sp.]|nr:peptidase M61 [Dyella sp.]
MATRSTGYSIGSKHLALGTLAGALLLAAAPHAMASTDRMVDVTLRPAAMDAAHAIPFVDVTIKVAPDAATGAPLLRLPLVSSNVKTVAQSLERLSASDADGPLTLSSQDDPDGSKPYRHWTAARAIHGPLTISYRAPITDALNPLGAAPPLELRSESGGFSGLAGTYVMLPDSDEAYRLKLAWDFSALGGDSLGVSTLGVGTQSSAPKTPEELESTFTMGGHINHEPSAPAVDGFFATWQGQPPFDARSLMQWTHRLYNSYLTFFDNHGVTYNVFLRRNKVNPGGGVEVANSFVGTFDEGTPVEEFKLTLAHEMVHTFVGALDEKDELAASWFSEGLAVYYQRLLPYRAGQITREAYLQDLNVTAARYYTDLLNTTPNEQIAARFWADTRVRVLPYDRGALYFAQLNAEIAKASHGKRSLDDLVLSFLKRRAAGQPLTQAAWVDAVTREVGASGKQHFDDMMSGKPIVLDSDTFGPCFQRTQEPMRRYELGFDPTVLVQPKRIIRGLAPGSAAAEAGLKDGDEILKPVPQDGIQADQTAKLKLQIRRDGKVFDVSYLPRGETVPTWQWVSNSGAACKVSR